MNNSISGAIMRKTAGFLFIILFILFGCSGSSQIPSDFSLSYSTKSELMKWEVNLSLSNESLKIDFKNSQGNTSGNSLYTIKDFEAEKIYKFMKSSGFIKTNITEGEKVLDAPTQNLTGVYSGKRNSVDFGNIKEPPDNISKLKQMLFELADKYNSNWRKDSGME